MNIKDLRALQFAQKLQAPDELLHVHDAARLQLLLRLSIQAAVIVVQQLFAVEALQQTAGALAEKR